MRPSSFPVLARELAAVGRRFHSRGWVLGTSGNFSAVVSTRPFRMAITASAIDKGILSARHILLVDDWSRIVPNGRKSGNSSRGARHVPSAETLLHLAIARTVSAGSVLHTHSVWSTMLSDGHGPSGGFTIEGYEMLKGLSGVTTHEHREWIPVIENDQNMSRLAGRVIAALERFPDAHGLLLRRHGLYTWGASVAEAARQVEILEFLFETIGRTATFSQREVYHGAAQNS